MGMLAIASAKGSPGATTLSAAIAALWPRECILVEADPAGSDLALRMPGVDGSPLDPQFGLVSLAAAGRKSLHHDLVPRHTQRMVGGQDVLLGVSGPDQAGAITMWAELGALLARLPGADAIVDLGRIGGLTPQAQMIADASAVVFVVDTLPSNVVHTRERIRRLRDQAEGGVGVAVHVAVVAPIKRARAVREVADALSSVEVLDDEIHHIAHDPKGAAFFLGQVSGSPERTAFIRSVRPLADQLAVRSAGLFVPGSRAFVEVNDQ